MNRADLKQRAKAQLGGSIFGSVWLYAVLVFFINALIQLVGGNFLLHLLMSIFIALWSLLLVVPGIIKALGWSMAYYIKVEHPEYTWKQCLDASTALTNGHKGDLFVLHLSFIGWYFVGSLCLGVGTLWVMPYHQATLTQCYHWLKSQQYSTYRPGGAV